MVEVKVESIHVSLSTEHRIVVLKDLSDQRYLPIWIGQCEADAINVGLSELQASRPFTHDLLKNTIAALSGEIVNIVISEMRRDTYYAHISVRLNGTEVEIDSRPSDAIALAVRTKAPIFVEDDVMAQCGLTPEEDVRSKDAGTKDLTAFRDFIDGLDLDDLPVQ